MTSAENLTKRALTWASTMEGHETVSAPRGGARSVRTAHVAPAPLEEDYGLFDRTAREQLEKETLALGATFSQGGGRRALPEEPDEWRTCFERDKDRILHSAAFRRLAGKTQVFIFPADHQRTRLTHALEVAQVAGAIARACRLNVSLTEAIALGHDCGHGPGGHACEDALSPFLEGGFDHAVWGAEVTTAGLNLCAETLDGIANHSWSRPAPATPEGEVVSLADRIAYTAHDLEDAVRAGIVEPTELPAVVAERCGPNRSAQLRAFITDVVVTSRSAGTVAMSSDTGEALASLRAYCYERIYLTKASLGQAERVIEMLQALVEHYAANPGDLPAERERLTGLAGAGDPVLDAVSYVAGMTDRYACAQAGKLLGFSKERLPRGAT